MELRRLRLSEELRAAREDLLNINFADKRFRTIIRKPDRVKVTVPPPAPWSMVNWWVDRWDTTFTKTNQLGSGMVNIKSSVTRLISGYEGEKDPEIFNELRADIVGFIDLGLRILNQEHEVKPLLEEYTNRVKDTKLAELLKEFNTVKDTSPNFAAMGFRTILSLILQEKAKRVNPQSKTAIATDLAPKQMLKDAANENILSQDEKRLVDSFVSTHKDIFDFVTHRPTILIDKTEVDTMVDLLNKLLPSIIN